MEIIKKKGFSVTCRFGALLMALFICAIFSACTSKPQVDVESVFESEAEKALNDGYVGEIVLDGDTYYLQLTEPVESILDSGEKYVTDKIYFESEEAEQLETMVGRCVCVKGTVFNYRGTSPLMFDSFELNEMAADENG